MDEGKYIIGVMVTNSPEEIDSEDAGNIFAIQAFIKPPQSWGDLSEEEKEEFSRDIPF